MTQCTVKDCPLCHAGGRSTRRTLHKALYHTARKRDSKNKSFGEVMFSDILVYAKQQTGLSAVSHLGRA